jgi:hypothetical protein
MKIGHYSSFNNLNKELVWEKLRNDETEQHYFIPYTKAAYLQKIDSEVIPATARIIIDEVGKLGFRKLFSIGSGIAAVEYQVKKNSDIEVTVSDYNNPVLRLKEFGVFDDAILFDAFLDPFPEGGDYVMLFPRIDTEFSNDQLSHLFEKCSAAGIKNIIFIPANILTYKGLLAELKILVYCLIKNKSRVFCGYMRTRSEFVKLWSKYYKVTKEFKNGQEFYLLTILK